MRVLQSPYSSPAAPTVGTKMLIVFNAGSISTNDETAQILDSKSSSPTTHRAGAFQIRIDKLKYHSRAY
ncbi:hypothetical protein V2A60_002728 [Cordyceps javanica]